MVSENIFEKNDKLINLKVLAEILDNAFVL